MTRQDKSPSMFDAAILKPAVVDELPQARPARAGDSNPVMFAVEVVALVATMILRARHRSAARRISASPARSSLWLWVTVLFANFAEAVAEGRGKAQADTLARARAARPWPSCCWASTTCSSRCAPTAQGRRHGAGRGGRPGARRRRGRRGRGHRRRIGHHRRISARHPRSGRRPLGGDRRHHGAVGPDQGPHHRRARARPSSTA